MGMEVNRKHASHQAILETGQYAINTPSVDMVTQTDCASLISGRRTDKSGLFEVHFSELENAMAIRQCPMAMAFRLLDQFTMTNDTLFRDELAAAWTEERLTDGHTGVGKVSSFTRTMPGNRYWAVGEQVGQTLDDDKAVKNPQRIKQLGGYLRIVADSC
ncbi:flavin reductase [Desulfovibrio sp. Huiquan2017]|uniref:flavin reductase n=1 Tax=Desulfovibrio sp. Huiquan2017 TaxID=2816861 RepID=UPI0025710C0B|nr:flavin reductase [Desulfovibrio sp. Huiquan2017]